MDKSFKLLIRMLLRFPNRLTNKIIYILLDYLKEGPIETKYGFLIYFKSTGFHPTAIRKSIIAGTYESSNLAMMKRFINPGDYVIDIGAHEGYISLFMSQLVGKNGKVFSIEPNQENLTFLRKNLNYNSITNIEVIGKAISNKKSKMPFHYDNDKGAWGSLTHFSHFQTKKTVKVDVDTLDNLFKDLQHKINFIKVDVEGNELNVFLGSEKILLEHKPNICFEVNLTFWALLNSSIDSLFSFLRKYGYELFVLKYGRLHQYKWLDERVISMFAIHRSRRSKLFDKGILNESIMVQRTS